MAVAQFPVDHRESQVLLPVWIIESSALGWGGYMVGFHFLVRKRRVSWKCVDFVSAILVIVERLYQFLETISNSFNGRKKAVKIKWILFIHLWNRVVGGLESSALQLFFSSLVKQLTNLLLSSQLLKSYQLTNAVFLT